MRPIDGDMLVKYCLNQKDKTVDCNDIVRFPKLDVKPVVHGEWIERFDDDEKWLICSECHGDNIIASDFCPHCGADMRKEQT